MSCLAVELVMSSAKPYIGCKIGLISKAQNRYEGILYTIDKVNSTVVLAKGECCRFVHKLRCRMTDKTSRPTNLLDCIKLFRLVKCFGTEGRPTDRPTAPKDDIYEYITFRGSDIKDITLCEPPRSHHGLPPDPAIVQVSEVEAPHLEAAQDECNRMCLLISLQVYSVIQCSPFRHLPYLWTIQPPKDDRL